MHQSLARSCSSAFQPGPRFAGAALARDGAVALEDVTEETATARVRAHGIVYRVVLDDYGNAAARRFRCACRPTAPHAMCEHVYAAVLVLDEMLGEVAQYEVSASAAGLAAEPAPAARRRAVGGWRQRIAPALPLPSLRPVRSAVPVVEYYVSCIERRDDEVLAVEVRTRTRKKNGELSAPRVRRLEDDELERLPAADRSLLGWMQRDQQREQGYAHHGWYGRGGLSLSAPWIVPVHALPAVMALLAATGRVHRAPVPAADEPPRPVRVDTGGPFVFEVHVQPRREGVVAVHGLLRRGDRMLEPAGMRFRDVDVAFVDDALVGIHCHGAAELQHVFADGPVELPAGELPDLLGELAVLRGADRFLEPCLEHLPVEPPIGVVEVGFPIGRDAPLRADLRFDYGGTIVGGDDPRPVVAGDRPARRDPAVERELGERARAAGLEPGLGGGLQCPREALPAVTAKLQQAGLRVFAAGSRLRPFVGGRGKVGTGVDWFEVGADFEFEGRSVTLPQLLRLQATPEGLVELDDGTMGILPERWLRQVEALRLLGGEPAGELVRLPSSQGLLLDALLASREEGDFVVDAQFAALRRRLETFRRIEPVSAPAAFRGELRPYQRDGLGWLAFLQQFGFGGCLADDMGLGKTVQVLAHLVATRARQRKARRPSLLVAPRSVLANWRAEAERFAPGLRVLDFSGADRWNEATGMAAAIDDSDLVLSTYAIVRADAVRFAEQKRRFRYVILDEAQAIKNADSQNAKAVRLLAADHRLALTGTPVENHLGELWSLFEFLNPGMLGRLPAFRALFGKETGIDVMAAHRELVQRALRPVLLRRTKAQVLLDLPDKIEQTVWCEMEPPQRRRYDELRAHYREKLLLGRGSFDGKQRFVVLEALLRLRQAACHEGLLDRRLRTPASAKFDELLPRLEDLAAEGHKALVFSQFTSLLDLLEPQLQQRGIVFERLDGRTRNRAARVERFQQDPACPVFLISLKAGGFGLNLTAAGYVFLLDPWWNPAVEMQAIDRAHRIGQQRVVNAYRVVCKGTVEERVLELQQQKKALCEAILGNERSLLQDLTRQDLELLLG